MKRFDEIFSIIFSVIPRNKMKTVALMLKTIHAQESKEAAKKVEDGMEETLTIWIFLPIGPGSKRITRLSVSIVRLNAVQK